MTGNPKVLGDARKAIPYSVSPEPELWGPARRNLPRGAALTIRIGRHQSTAFQEGPRAIAPTSSWGPTSLNTPMRADQTMSGLDRSWKPFGQD